MLQLGFIPSHFSFRFLHIMHARRLGLGTLAFPPGPISFAAAPPGSETITVSGGVSDEDDMSIACCKFRRRYAWACPILPLFPDGARPSGAE